MDLIVGISDDKKSFVIISALKAIRQFFVQQKNLSLENSVNNTGFAHYVNFNLQEQYCVLNVPACSAWYTYVIQ